MTRIAIVAPSARLRASLAAALRASPEFEVVGGTASDADVPSSVEVILVAHDGDDSGLRALPTRSAATVAPILSNREREILALLADGLANKQIAARLFVSRKTL